MNEQGKKKSKKKTEDEDIYPTPSGILRHLSADINAYSLIHKQAYTYVYTVFGDEQSQGRNSLRG